MQINLWPWIWQQKYCVGLPAGQYFMEWQPIATAPFDRDLELAVINYDGVHALAFPCRRILGSWMNAETKKRIDVKPTHWREWTDPR
jgi:hypothetical protein